MKMGKIIGCTLGVTCLIQVLMYYLFIHMSQQQSETIQSILTNRALQIQSQIEDRISVLNGISSFIETVGFQADASTIEQYLSHTYQHVDQVYNVLIAPNGIITYVFPYDNNSVILHKSFFNPELANPDLIREALISRQITIENPRNLLQGGYAVIARKAIFTDDHFDGIVSVSLRIQDILTPTFAEDPSLFILKPDHTLLFGNQPAVGKQMFSTPIQIYNQTWIVGHVKSRGEAISILKSIIILDFIIFACLITSVFLLYKHRFGRQLERTVHVRTKELQLSQQKYEELAFRDSLTGISNRLHFQQELDRVVASSNSQNLCNESSADPFCLLYMDLNDFKPINDTYGHDIGDEVLVTVVDRIVELRLGYQMFARIGGDEFTMLFRNKSIDELNSACDKISRVTAIPMTIRGNLVSLSISIGMAIYPEHGTSREALLKHADAAMYRAKRNTQTIA